MLIGQGKPWSGESCHQDGWLCAKHRPLWDKEHLKLNLLPLLLLILHLSPRPYRRYNCHELFVVFTLLSLYSYSEANPVPNAQSFWTLGPRVTSLTPCWRPSGAKRGKWTICVALHQRSASLYVGMTVHCAIPYYQGPLSIVQAFSLPL